ncbi:MAG: MFS transporter, partial [Sphaerochaeta sp.]
MNSGESKPRFLSNAGFSLYAGLDKSIYTLFAVRIINRFGDFVQMLLVLILTVKLGMSDHEAGIFITFTIIATMVGQLTAGVVADKLARKYVLVFCQLMICVSYLLCAVFIESAFFSLVPLLILLGSPFRGATHPITSSMVADFSSESDRGRSFSLLYLGTNIGVALGPMAAAFLYARSLPLLFAGSSGLLLISTIVLWIKVPLLRSDVFISASPKSEKGFVS